MIPFPTAWKHIYSNLNVSGIKDMWTVSRDKLMEVQRTTIPMKSRRVNSAVNSPWMTMAIKRAINAKTKSGIKI